MHSTPDSTVVNVLKVRWHINYIDVSHHVPEIASAREREREISMNILLLLAKARNRTHESKKN